MIPPTTLILFNLFACIAGISRTVQSSDPRWGEPHMAAATICKNRKLLQQQSRHAGAKKGASQDARPFLSL